MENITPLLDLIFKAIAVAMAVAFVVLSIMNMAPEVSVLLLGIGLFTLSVSSLPKSKGAG